MDGAALNEGERYLSAAKPVFPAVCARRWRLCRSGNQSRKLNSVSEGWINMNASSCHVDGETSMQATLRRMCSADSKMTLDQVTARRMLDHGGPIGSKGLAALVHQLVSTIANSDRVGPQNLCTHRLSLCYSGIGSGRHHLTYEYGLNAQPFVRHAQTLLPPGREELLWLVSLA